MEEPTKPTGPKLLDQFRAALRVKHYAYSTEKSYVYWARRFIYFHNKKHPRNMGTYEVQAFLSYLAQHDNVAASTQNQALNALVFLYKQVIKKEIGSIDAVRARRPKRLPVVLTQLEVEKILALLSDTTAIMATLLYGSGLRLMECHRLRVKDIDFEQRQIAVRDGKGSKVVIRLPREAHRLRCVRDAPVGIFISGLYIILRLLSLDTTRNLPPGYPDRLYGCQLQDRRFCRPRQWPAHVL